MGRVVLVVDMLRGFLKEGYPLFCGTHARSVINPIRSLLRGELAAGSKVLFVCDAHVPSDPEIDLEIFPEHCMKDTAQAEIVPELREFVPHAEVFEKHAYSGFTSPKFDDRIRKLNPDLITIVGVCTDICVLHTAADAFFRGYKIEVPGDCVASFNQQNHAFGLQHLRDSLGACEPRTPVS